jgi:predicted ArsR family transcriptional regulator
MGLEARRRAGPRPGRKRLLQVAVDQLGSSGFEPHSEDHVIRLRNCPFDRIAREHRSLVCGASVALIRSFLEALDLPGLTASLEPEAGRCCVVLRSAGAA